MTYVDDKTFEHIFGALVIRSALHLQRSSFKVVGCVNICGREGCSYGVSEGRAVSRKSCVKGYVEGGVDGCAEGWFKGKTFFGHICDRADGALHFLPWLSLFI